ncbi:SusC/RagA family TonB-linked outer membrane protein [Sphingobacterium detergens]|uniref:TonB-linked SusC/RagA family outer membrane protein n=1 Tax=Sphingobacterium detergens TaxID=1145106 RepID=A0A420BLF5_SPHD1|nr:TonB-dependent receptor [Sphingobacterium detergens]RKE57510.1 TonB-linked SusC/RagA family outer membrane protein [Sphingobacterium detergens]
MQKRKEKLFLFLLLFTLPMLSFAQKQLTGIVKDASNGEKIEGVTILKNRVPVTKTNANGEFQLSGIVGDSLVFTFVGKKDETRVIGPQNIIEVLLYDDGKSLDEVTVVAFGTQKKATVVGAITTVKASDLKIPATNLTSAFAGRIPGVISFQNSGEPGADNAQFFVRGVTTFGYQASPLILIDGFESTTDNLARMQPDDIESFSILKDASATVLYGARGANGIIMVTTKAGREGPVGLNARVDVNTASPTRMIKMVDGIDYMKLYNEARMTRDPILGPYYSQQKIQSTIDNENPMIFPNIDWYNTLLKNYTVNTKANVNLSGGGQVATYYVSGGFDKESGLLKVDDRNNFNNNININRFFIRSNVIFKLTKTTTLDTRIQGRFERYNGPFRSASDIFRMVMNSNPVDFPAVFSPDTKNEFTQHTLFGNTFVTGSLKNNPYAEMVRGYEDRNENTITAQATLMQDLAFLTPGLKLQGRASVTTWSKYAGTRSYDPFYYDLENYNQITGEYSLYALNPTTGRATLGDVDPKRDASSNYYFEARFNWNRSFGNHNLGAMTVGMIEEKLLTSGNSNSIYETLPERNMGNSGRLTYDFDNKYFAEFAYGLNGSEKFMGQKRFGFFPSLGGGWMVSSERFFEPLKSVVSTLKLRGTWGRVGNDAIAERRDRFFYLSDISRGNDAMYRWGTDFMNAYNGFNVNRYANPDITWEESEKWNVGIEANFFNESLKLQGDFFKDVRSKIYMRRENFPASAGLEAAISGNVGKVSSQGFDGSLTYQKFFGSDLWLSARANFTYATNKYLALDEKNYADTYLKKLGHNLRQEWGLLAERLFVDQYEIDNSPRQDFGEYMAGDIKYKDINGDGIINDNDRIPMGYPTVPEIQYGFGMSAGYKAFDFSFFFQGNKNVSFFINSTAESNPNTGSYGIAPFASRRNALAIIADNYWSETNPNTHAFWPRLSTDPINNNTQQSSWWLRDGSFIRLKSLEIGYSPRNLERFGFGKGSRIYISGENLAVFSPFKLWDPESGRNGLGYPPNRRFNVGIQLSF